MLSDLAEDVRNYPGLRRKKAISSYVEVLRPVEDLGHTTIGIGDDSAVLKMGTDNLLFASDGIWTQLHSDPFWAGYCSVLVNVNDIYAMGGVPLGMTNNISYTSQEEGDLIAKGIKEACEKFNVAMVGGHTNPDADFLSISVSIVGRADKLITSTGCEVGDDLIIAIDLDGEKKGEFLNWDSTSGKSSEIVLGQLGCLVEISDRELVNAGKDISNPGILGTVGMLLETSKKGAVIDLDSIPIPEGVGLDEWVLIYPGFGFVLTCSPERSREVIRVFQEKHVIAEVVGRITETRRLTIKKGEEEEVLFDFETDSITGIS